MKLQKKYIYTQKSFVIIPVRAKQSKYSVRFIHICGNLKSTKTFQNFRGKIQYIELSVSYTTELGKFGRYICSKSLPISPYIQNICLHQSTCRSLLLLMTFKSVVNGDFGNYFHIPVQRINFCLPCHENESLKCFLADTLKTQTDISIVRTRILLLNPIPCSAGDILIERQ